MGNAGFDDRLDGIMTRAAIRLQERMRLAYFRGNLTEYLTKIGLAEELEEDLLNKGSLLEIQDEAAVVLAVKIRRARKVGYLKDMLKQFNMLELLYREKDKRIRKTEIKKQLAMPYREETGLHVGLRLVEGENKHSAESAKDKDFRLVQLKVIK